MSNKTTNYIQKRHTGYRGKDGKPYNSQTGDEGKDGYLIPYERLWDRLKEDIGLKNIILIFLGSILLIFSPEKGWEFVDPFFNYALAYRGWLGIICFIFVLTSKILNKKKNTLLKTENKESNIIQTSSELDTTSLKPINPVNEETNEPDATSSKPVNPVNEETSEPDATSSKPVNPVNEETNGGIKSMYVHFSKDKLNYLSFMFSLLYMCDNYNNAMLLLVHFHNLFNGQIFYSPFIQVFAKEKLTTPKGKDGKEWCWWYWDGGNEGFQLVISLCK